jgi:DNA mismatch endonuclease, patch repair protein
VHRRADSWFMQRTTRVLACTTDQYSLSSSTYVNCEIMTTFVGLKPRSLGTTRCARAASRKRDTKPELLLRRQLHALGMRYRVDVAKLPGRPDIVFHSVRVAVFVDGDFWHGRNLRSRLDRLSRGHNSAYWSRKISANHARDRRVSAQLRKMGWGVLRLWESDIQRTCNSVAQKVRRSVAQAKRDRSTLRWRTKLR